MYSQNSLDTTNLKYLDSVIKKVVCLTLVAESYCHKCENITAFYYIHARFLFSAGHHYVYLTALKL